MAREDFSKIILGGNDSGFTGDSRCVQQFFEGFGCRLSAGLVLNEPQQSNRSIRPFQVQGQQMSYKASSGNRSLFLLALSLE